MRVDTIARMGCLLILCVAGSWFQSGRAAQPAAGSSPADTGSGCQYGYHEDAKQQCVAVSVPQNSYLNAFGDDWSCYRGFHRVQDHCERIVVPRNGHLTDFGWECNRGYVQSQNACNLVRVPAHGFLTAEGNNWRCDRGYERNDAVCRAITVPAHAYLNDYGDGWKCQRGYRVSGNSCVAIELPKNAHLDTSGNSWLCNWGYEIQEDQCAPRALSQTYAAQSPDH